MIFNNLSSILSSNGIIILGLSFSKVNDGLENLNDIVSHSTFLEICTFIYNVLISLITYSSKTLDIIPSILYLSLILNNS